MALRIRLNAALAMVRFRTVSYSYHHSNGRKTPNLWMHNAHNELFSVNYVSKFKSNYCAQCGTVILDDTKALQCDRCVWDTWIGYVLIV